MSPRAFPCVVVLLAACLAGPLAAHAENIVQNGGFELPIVTDPHNWDIFEEISGWQLVRGENIELHRGVNGWLPAEGAQYLELDSDFDGPGGSMSGEPASSAVFQDLPTQVGCLYDLTFAFSPRPGVSDNTLEIKWDGEIVDVLTADGTGLCNTNWQYYTYRLTAGSESSRLEFGDLSVSDSLGTFVDDVSVTFVPEPLSAILLACGVVSLCQRKRKARS